MNEDILAQALSLGKEQHPGAPPAHHAAFANAVAYAVTGWSGGYGGPRMREHWASRLLHSEGEPGKFSFDDAVCIVEEACFGPITMEIARMLELEHCFDDAPGEKEEAFALLAKEAGGD